MSPNVAADASASWRDSPIDLADPCDQSRISLADLPKIDVGLGDGLVQVGCLVDGALEDADDPDGGDGGERPRTSAAVLRIPRPKLSAVRFGLLEAAVEPAGVGDEVPADRLSHCLPPPPSRRATPRAVQR